LNVVKTILDNCDDINYKSDFIKKILLRSSRFDNLEFIEFLIQNGVDINVAGIDVMS